MPASLLVPLATFCERRGPLGVCLDALGNVYVADSGGNGSIAVLYGGAGAPARIFTDSVVRPQGVFARGSDIYVLNGDAESSVLKFAGGSEPPKPSASRARSTPP